MRMSIVIKTSFPFPGMGLTASGGEGPFAITSKIVKLLQNQTFPHVLFATVDHYIETDR